MTCYHRPWTALTIVRRLALHVIIALGQHTRFYYVGRGMLYTPLDCTYGWTTSGVV